MTAGDIDRRADVATPAHIIASAVGTAEALAIGVVRLAERTLVEAVHAAEDVGAEIGSTLVSATRGSIRAASDIGGDLADMGRTVARGVADPVRKLGSGLARVTNGLRRAAPVRHRSRDGARKPLGKSATRRHRRRAAA
jgi:hypothetical protein